MAEYLISKDLKSYIEKHDNQYLRVHSVFKDALNLIDEEDNLITLLTPVKGIAPMSATIPISEQILNQIRPGDGAEIKDMSLIFMHPLLTIDFDDVKVWNPDMFRKSKPLEMERLSVRTDKLKEIIIHSGQLEGIVALIEVVEFDQAHLVVSTASEPLNEYADFIEERLLKLLNLFYRREIDGVKDFIPKFVGFGPGLTPSTDDFLLGMMVSMIFEAKLQGSTLKSALAQADSLYESTKGKTTKVAEEMLRHGAAAKLSGNYKAAAQAMFYDVKAPLERLAAQAISNGSTSGTDFLFGVYCYSQLRLKWNREGGI